MVQHGPVSSVTKFYGREIDSVEIYIILAHELIETDVLGVKPPLLPLGGIVCGNAWISKRSVELVGWFQYFQINKRLLPQQ